MKGWLVTLPLAALVLAGCGAHASPKLLAKQPRPPELTIGWKTDFSRHTVPFAEIQSGGPAKDGTRRPTRLNRGLLTNWALGG